MIRLNVGYGKTLTKRDLLMPMACTRGLDLPEGVSTNDVLEDLVKYGFLRNFGSSEETEYILIRTDKRKEPIVGFNPRRQRK